MRDRQACVQFMDFSNHAPGHGAGIRCDSGYGIGLPINGAIGIEGGRRLEMILMDVTDHANNGSPAGLCL